MDLMTVFVGVAGGLGLFLLGMALMTEGLKTLAGDAIRGALMRFTRSPFTGMLTGVVGTAVLQSSSATIIATVGFVGAGLLSFSQALGIIIGSALGTTFTGWLVALLGFKLQITAVAAVLVFAGALMRLFAGRRWGGLGYALAGFGLIFIGIAGLQEGLDGLRGYVDFSGFAVDSLWGKLKLVAIGVIFTIITQSSSAGVVAALTALFAGTINFEQAAALVVGMNIGTSFTAAAATIGGNIHVRRTGFSHVLYNTTVSSLAVFLITPYIALWQWWAPGQLYANAEVALVAFHTSFNLLGVVLVLPFARQFAHFIERLFPDKVYPYQKILDRGLLQYPELALTAVHTVLTKEVQRTAEQLAYLLGDSSRPRPLGEGDGELDAVEDYIDAIHLEQTQGSQWERLLAALHVVDHLQRLQDRSENKSIRMALRSEERMLEAKQLVSQMAAELLHPKGLTAEQVREWVDELTVMEDNVRQLTLQQVAQGRMELKQGVSMMDLIRWLQHVAVHIEKIGAYMRELNYRQPQSADPGSGHHD
ncbi:Na/Pi cotransporter family protein [Marinimicrobium alkaliphilum]|uniref:Na/Pi cotransporter family protein n=1 Tax=Marinimicrobium alkaliphilum TaxID=2202654 RepID=UPI000DBA452B|nr:Na/Pi symporter [Marinimicrobium alkaliphilum]